MPQPDYSELGECELCRTETFVTANGICRKCFNKLADTKADPFLREKRLRQIAQSENGVIRETRRLMLRDTHQVPPESKLTLNRVLRRRDSDVPPVVEMALKATPEQLAARLPSDVLRVEVAEVNAELIRWFAKHPEAMHELPSQKFEEVIAEILRDMGYDVLLTKPTRDGGRDVLVGIPTPFGKLLVIVECKRWAPQRPVDLDVVRSFLHVLRENDKANAGIIATTATFTADAQKEARKFKYLLRLADWQRIREWAAQYGRWFKPPGSELWLPEDIVAAGPGAAE